MKSGVCFPYGHQCSCCWMRETPAVDGPRKMICFLLPHAATRSPVPGAIIPSLLTRMISASSLFVVTSRPVARSSTRDLPDTKYTVPVEFFS